MAIQMVGTAIRWIEHDNIPSSLLHQPAANKCKGQLACDAIVNYLGKKVKGLGGLIMIEKNQERLTGNYAFSFNTQKMALAYVENNCNNNEFEIKSSVNYL